MAINAITPDSLNTPDLLNLAPNTNKLIADLPGLNTNYQDLLDSISADQASIKALQEQGLNKGKDTVNANELAGVNNASLDVNKYSEQLAQLNAQASSLNRESQAIPIANRLAYKGSAGTENQVQNVNYDQLSENALKALSIGQQADIANAALTGSTIRLQAAKDKAQQIVDLKYKPIEEQIKNKLQQYELRKDLLSEIDKKRSEALGIALKKEEESILQKKADEKAISDMIVNASSANAPKDLLAAASTAKNPTEAAMILKEYAGNYYQTQLLKAQIEKQKADTAKTRTEVNTANSVSAATAASTTAKSWLDQYNSGALSLEDIYTKIGSSKEALKLKNEVAALVAAQGGKRVYGQDDASVQAIQSQIKNVDDLLNGDVGSIVGLVQGGLGILPDSLNIYKQDALATAKNLVSNQTLQSLADAKAKGITFGALSEAELNAVSNASGRIASKLIIDPKTKEITGFSGSEGEFKKDLQIVKEGLQKSIANKTQSILNPFQQSLNGGVKTFIPGTAIIKNVSDNGAIDFAIPK